MVILRTLIKYNHNHLKEILDFIIKGIGAGSLGISSLWIGIQVIFLDIYRKIFGRLLLCLEWDPQTEFEMCFI